MAYINRGINGREKILDASVAFPSQMDARRPVHIAPARRPLRPLVRLAVRVLGPGPLRLRMVKFAHDLDTNYSQPLRKAA